MGGKSVGNTARLDLIKDQLDAIFYQAGDCAALIASVIALRYFRVVIYSCAGTLGNGYISRDKNLIENMKRGDSRNAKL